MGLTIDPTKIQDIESARQAIVELFNLVEELQQENVKLHAENQRLRDENNRLKGEQGQPDIKPDKKPNLLKRDLARLNQQQQARVLEAAALSAYHQQTTIPIVPLLLSDDAPQFQHLTDEQALCWLHEGRHYKKLIPTVAYHQQLLTDFLTDFWNFYHQLQRYRASPSLAQAQQLSYQFDTLFSTVTGYDALDKRIAKTKARKDKLLMVLKYPHIPLHNNPAELGARHRVRKRDVSFGPRTQDGVAAWDTFMTLAATAKKLGVSFFAYIYDRVSEAYLLPSLAELIRQQSPAIHPAFSE